MQANYNAFCERLIQRYENGYGWDRNDNGGPTKFGITAWDLAEHRHQRMDSFAHWASIVKAMPLSEAEDIYREKYATACRFDDLPSGADCAVFDFGVNSGSSRAIKYAQRVVGVAQDGVIGPITLAAINKANPTDFVNQLCDERMAFLRGLKIWSSFGKGWSARVADLRRYCLALVQKPQVAATAPRRKKLRRIPGARVKAYLENRE